MSPENFVYWLQGMFEIGNPTTLNEQQVQMIKDHIGLVLNKVTPSKCCSNPSAGIINATPFGIYTPTDTHYGFQLCSDRLPEIPCSTNYVIEASC